MFRALLVRHQGAHYTTVNVLHDDGPVSSEMRSSSMFFKNIIVN
jgi:hypothetical protein